MTTRGRRAGGEIGVRGWGRGVPEGFLVTSPYFLATLCIEYCIAVLSLLTSFRYTCTEECHTVLHLTMQTSVHRMFLLVADCGALFDGSIITGE